MDLGIILGDVEAGTSPPHHLGHMLAQAEAAQRAGIRYLTVGQHFLYSGPRWIQPIPLLARLAAEVDPAMRLATTVLLAPLYHPVVLAEELASLDIVTEGRLVAGFGLGYRTAEYASLGVDFATRGARLDEALDLITRMWTSGRVDFEGEHFSVHGPTHLRPWQQPRPPIWIGADSARGVRRAAVKGDAWVIGPTKPVDEIEALIGVFEEERSGGIRAVHPIRRDLSLGADKATALEAFAAATSARNQSYVDNERAGYEPPSPEVLAGRIIHGSVDDCTTQIAELAYRVPVDPLIVRPAWPGMTTAEVVRWIDGLTELVAAVAEIPSAVAR